MSREEDSRNVSNLIMRLHTMHQPNAVNPFVEKGSKFKLTLGAIDIISELNPQTVNLILTVMINTLNDPKFEGDEGVRDELMFCVVHFAYVMHNENILTALEYLYKHVINLINDDTYAMIFGMYLHDTLYDNADYYVLASHSDSHKKPYAVWLVAKYDLEEEARSNMAPIDNDICFVVKGIDEDTLCGVFGFISNEDRNTFINFVKNSLTYIVPDVVVLSDSECC